MKKIPNVKVMTTEKVVDSSGVERFWTQEQLDAFAANYSYDSDVNAAPVILGHVEDSDRPRFGYVESLRSDKNCLYADLQVTEEFADAVREGIYPNRSVCVSAKTPKFYHLGFLGAARPAFKDLGKIQFSEKLDADACEFSVDGDVAKIGLQNIADLAFKILNKLDEIGKTIDAVSSNSQARDYPERDYPETADGGHKTGLSRKCEHGEHCERDAQFAEIKAERGAQAEVDALRLQLETYCAKEAMDFAEKQIGEKKIHASLKELVAKDFAEAKKANKLDELRARYNALPALVLPQPPKIEGATAQQSPAEFSEAVKKYALENNVSAKQAAITLSNVYNSKGA